MKRDIQKAIEEYQKKFGRRSGSRNNFTASDIEQILALSRNGSVTTDTGLAISLALEAGFMLGYRKRSREE